MMHASTQNIFRSWSSKLILLTIAVFGWPMCSVVAQDDADAQSEKSESAFLLTVTAESAEVVVRNTEKDTNRVIVRLAKGTPLYALDATRSWFQVNAPNKMTLGWIRKTDVRRLHLTSEQRAMFHDLKEVVDNAQQHLDRNEVGKAHAVCVRGVEICKKLPSFSLETITATKGFLEFSSFGLGTELIAWNERRDLSLRNFETCRRIMGDSHYQTFSTMFSLTRAGRIGSLAGHLDDAESLFVTCTEFCDAIYGKKSLRTTVCLEAYGEFLLRKGRTEESVKLLERSLSIWKEHAPKNDENLLSATTLLAETYVKVGRDFEAEELFTSALTITEEKFGESAWETVQPRYHLGSFFDSIGEHAKCVALTKRNVEIAKMRHGAISREYAYQLYWLGMVYEQHGDTREATKAFQRSISVSDALPNKGQQDGFGAKLNLASVYQSVRELEKAKALYLELLEDRLQTHGENHNNTIFVMEGLAETLMEMGEFDQAIQLHRKRLRIARKIDDPSAPHVLDFAICLAKAGQAAEAEAMFQLNIEHEANGRFYYDPDQSKAISQLAKFYVHTDQLPKAVSTEDIARRQITRYASKRLSWLTEVRRRAFLKEDFQPDLFRALTLGYQHRDHAGSALLSAGWLLNAKSLAQEIFTDAAKLSSYSESPALKKLRTVNAQLANVSLRNDSENASVSERVNKLKIKQNELLAELSDLGFSHQQRADWIPIEQLIGAVPSKALFVNIAKFRTYDFDGSFEEGTPVWKAERYAAWIVPPAEAGEVVCIDLGEALPIDTAVKNVRTQILAAGIQIGIKGESVVETTLTKSLTELSELVVAPLYPHLENVKELIVSPDGALWTIPWESLIAKDGNYLLEELSVRYLLSGRELVNESVENFETQQAVVIADPDFNRSNGPQVLLEPKQVLATRELEPVLFPQLRASLAEAAGIKPALENYLKSPVKLLLQADAHEAAFKQLQRPRILVLSTHGYFEQNRHVANPLLRCGLALAGCNVRDTPVATGRQDGILTGLEIIGTDLRGTELVVLSACETGLGDVQNGEGVAGLRQVFQLAGAESVRVKPLAS